jgi:hypothetical protein
MLSQLCETVHPFECVIPSVAVVFHQRRPKSTLLETTVAVFRLPNRWPFTHFKTARFVHSRTPPTGLWCFHSLVSDFLFCGWRLGHNQTPIVQARCRSARLDQACGSCGVFAGIDSTTGRPRPPISTVLRPLFGPVVTTRGSPLGYSDGLGGRANSLMYWPVSWPTALGMIVF